MGRITAEYMNVGRGCVATHVFVESCAKKGMGICFVGECWVARSVSGTQSHPDYVMLGHATKGTKVVSFVRKDLVDGVELVVATARAVARVRYSTALPHLLLFIIFLISHIYYICYFLLKHVRTSG